VRRFVWLLGSIALAVVAAACGGEDGAKEGPERTGWAGLPGVWVVALAPDAEDQEVPLCIEITEIGPAGRGRGTSFGGELYMDGELSGGVAGLLDLENLLTFGGSSDMSLFSGRLNDGNRAAGTWGRTSGDVVRAFGSWSAGKTDKASCP
jgi:hypothetical protein